MAFGTVTNIGTNQNASGTTVAATVPAGGVPAGATIIVLVAECSATSVARSPGGSLTDTAGNVYTRITTVAPNGATGDGFAAVYYSQTGNALVSGNTITFTKVATADGAAISACYVTGAGALDAAVTATAHGTGTTFSVTSGTPGGSGRLFVGLLYEFDSTPTLVPSGWTAQPTLVAQTSGAFIAIGGANKINAGSAAVTYSPTDSTSNDWGSMIIAFAPASTTDSATWATTEAADTMSASASVYWSATWATTEAADTMSASASVYWPATLAVTDATDSLSGAASVFWSTTWATTEAKDTLAANTNVFWSVTWATTEAKDTLSASASVYWPVTWATTEAKDTLAAAVSTFWTATWVTTESADTFAGSVSVISPITWAATEPDDTLAAAADGGGTTRRAVGWVVDWDKPEKRGSRPFAEIERVLDDLERAKRGKSKKARKAIAATEDALRSLSAVDLPSEADKLAEQQRIAAEAARELSRLHHIALARLAGESLARMARDAAELQERLATEARIRAETDAEEAAILLALVA